MSRFKEGDARVVRAFCFPTTIKAPHLPRLTPKGLSFTSHFNCSSSIERASATSMDMSDLTQSSGAAMATLTITILAE
jgi:hypothetical protein